MGRGPRRSPTLVGPEPLETILGRSGENRFAKSRPPIDAETWRGAVGARIADRAQPVSLQSGTLVLRVPNSVWAHELSLLTDHLRARLRERGVEVTQLRFRVGEPPLAERRLVPRVSRAVPTVRALPSELAQVLRGVEDPELRGSIARAAAANLAWQTTAGPAPPQEITEARRAVRAPRSSAPESAPPDSAWPASPEGAPGTPGGGRGRAR